MICTGHGQQSRIPCCGAAAIRGPAQNCECLFAEHLAQTAKDQFQYYEAIKTRKDEEQLDLVKDQHQHLTALVTSVESRCSELAVDVSELNKQVKALWDRAAGDLAVGMAGCGMETGNRATAFSMNRGP